MFDDEEDEADRVPGDWEEALSTASSEHPYRPLSRSNSHSSDLSERLTIAPIPPTMLKVKDEGPEDDDDRFMMGSGDKAAKENGHSRRAREGPVLVYAPPTGSDSVYAPRDVNHQGVVEADATVFDYVDASEHRRHHYRYGSRHELPDGEIIVGGYTRKRTLSNGSQTHNIDSGGSGGGVQVLYSTVGHHIQGRILDRDHLLGDSAAEKTGINTPASTSNISTSAVYVSISSASSTSTLHQSQLEQVQEEQEPEASIGGATTPPIPIPRSPRSSSPTLTPDTSYAIYGMDERRGRTLARTSSASSLNERVKNVAGSIGVSVGSTGGVGSSGNGVEISPVGGSSLDSSRASSSRASSAGVGRGRGVSKLDTSSSREDIPSGLPAANEAAKPPLSPSTAVPPTPAFSTGLVDKAKGMLGTLLGHTAAAVAPATNPSAAPPPPSPHRSQF